jgi:8-oxo-dGTP diphosphatase
MGMKFATLCYLRRSGKTLMVHRVKKENDIHQGKWNGLGGKLEPGETPEECAIREIYEESGLRVRRLDFKGLLTFPGFANEEDWYAFVFVATDIEGELVESPEGELCWIEDELLCDLDLWAGDRIFLEWLDSPGFFSAKFIYKNGEFVDYDVVFYPQG